MSEVEQQEFLDEHNEDDEVEIVNGDADAQQGHTNADDTEARQGQSQEELTRQGFSEGQARQGPADQMAAGSGEGRPVPSLAEVASAVNMSFGELGVTAAAALSQEPSTPGQDLSLPVSAPVA